MLTYPDIDPVLLSIGPLSIRWYGLAYLSGVLLAITVLWPRFSRLGLTTDDGLSLISRLLCGILIGGRLGYCLIYQLPHTLSSPLSIFAIWNGGMSFHGGAIGAAVAMLLTARRHQFSAWLSVDLLALGAVFGLFFGRIANFINAELVGRITTSPLGMVFPGAGPLPRHPSQLYEAALEGLLLGIILWGIDRWGSPPKGVIFSLFLILYGSFRFGAEYLREPDPSLGLFFSLFSMGQLLCLVMITLGITSLWCRWRRLSLDRLNRTVV